MPALLLAALLVLSPPLAAAGPSRVVLWGEAHRSREAKLKRAALERAAGEGAILLAVEAEFAGRPPRPGSAARGLESPPSRYVAHFYHLLQLAALFDSARDPRTSLGLAEQLLLNLYTLLSELPEQPLLRGAFAAYATQPAPAGAEDYFFAAGRAVVAAAGKDAVEGRLDQLNPLPWIERDPDGFDRFLRRFLLALIAEIEVGAGEPPPVGLARLKELAGRRRGYEELRPHQHDYMIAWRDLDFARNLAALAVSADGRELHAMMGSNHLPGTAAALRRLLPSVFVEELSFDAEGLTRR